MSQNSVSARVRELLAEDIDRPTAQVVAALRKEGIKKSPELLTKLVYNVKSTLRKGGGQQQPKAPPPLPAAPSAARATPATPPSPDALTSVGRHLAAVHALAGRCGGLSVVGEVNDLVHEVGGPEVMAKLLEILSNLGSGME
jgi:hypothetical protein